MSGWYFRPLPESTQFQPFDHRYRRINSLDQSSPLWKVAVAAEQAVNDPKWDSSVQSAPEIKFDQRT